MIENEGDRMDYVLYRLDKAVETYHAAQVLYEAECWNSVINRLYYSCFYAASALLMHNHLSAKTHAGIIGKFSEHFVRSGIFTMDEFRVYAKLLTWRTKGDYNDMYDFHKEDVASMLSPTKHFIDKVKDLIIVE